MKNFILERNRSALLIIDIQDTMLAAIPNRDSMLKNSRILLKAGLAYQLPLFASEHYPKGLGETNPSLQACWGDRLSFKLNKTAFNGCQAEMLEALKSSGRKQIIVAGAETHICVMQTVRQLLGEGFEVFIASDAVGSRSEDNRKNGLDLMSEMGAVISNTEAILFDLIGDAKDPQFKALQQLIK